MKTKRTIYFLLIVTGALIIGVGEYYFPKEYVLGIGLVLMMYGLYKSTQVWIRDRDQNEEENGKEDL
ncbi:hypothetical protein K8352_14405 [Flavobacteriaceae bacterium F89]|uniref:Uncharacterized protein n=1 Tax=Cerina litoralis TaxID=2874477 RepID=A0AAE3EW21_9FLAO|nr:hypothetical protein [Cerina litoralis]MCG2461948.1 hypothetical protein [Cerina litoralis]